MDAIQILVAAALVGAAVPTDWRSTPRASAREAERTERSESRVYYSGCDEVRALGKAPLYAGQPGYRIGMDGDRDGIACEPHRNR